MTAPTPANPIVLYDIATRPPAAKTCCSPNPWKARFALNFKAVPFTTTWVQMPDITKVRSGLNIPPVRKFADGTDFYTLPIIQDPTTGALVGDSFDIAIYLQKTYPDAGAGDLFPALDALGDWVLAKEHSILVPLTEARGDGLWPDYAQFNVNVDAAFTLHVGLTVQGFPFDPATAEASKAEFVRRAGVARFEDFELKGEAREKVKESFKEMLGGLAVLYKRDPSGPFLLGQRASYADMIIGAWWRMFYGTLEAKEFDEITGWHDGVFRQLHDALEAFAKA
jgi:glutathione S-transferase